MKSKIAWHMIRHLRKVWVRVLAFALLAVLTVFVAQVIAPFIPAAWTISIGADSVDKVLDVLASSMLAVTTFSLAIAISAFAAAASTATPRASALLQEDSTAQNVLATFLGAFLFSLVGIIALQGGYYTSSGRLVLFVATGLVIAAVVMALLRWISHLMTFGRMGDTLDRVEAAATAALDQRLDTPYLGGNPLYTEVPSTCFAVFSQQIGYVQHVDVKALNSCAEELNLKIWLEVLPGTFVHQTSTLFHINQSTVEEACVKQMRAAFTIGSERDFQQDPRFGLIVLSEIASRALSPAVNDPGTAISVIGRLVRILSRWSENSDNKVTCGATFVPAILPADMIDDAFRPIARDGAAIAEVQIRLQKALNAIAEASPIFSDAAKALATDARAKAQETLTAREYQQLEEVKTVVSPRRLVHIKG